MPGSRPRHPSGPLVRSGAGLTPAVVWLAALLILLVLPFFLYHAFAANIERMDDRITRVASEQLEPFTRRSGAGRDLAAKTTELLSRDDLGLNYLTLRNTDGKILLSGGRFETLGESLSPEGARRLRSWLYRLVSADRVLSLRRNGRLSGHAAYGIDLRHVAATMSIWFWLGFSLWLLALVFTFVLLGSVRALLGRESDRNVSVEPETELTELLQNVHNAESDWRDIADTLGVGVAVVDGMQRVQSANKLFGELIGRSDGSLRGRAADELAVFMDEWGEERLSPLQRCLAGEAGPLRETLSVAGRRVTMIAARTEDEQTYALLWAADEADLKRGNVAAVSDFAATALWTHSEEAAALVDVEGIVRNVNPAFCRLLGQEEIVLVDKPLVRLLPDAGGALLSAEDVIRGETAADADDGERMAYRLAMIDTAGVPTYLMTLQPLQEPEKEPLEPNDALTGLPVRATLMKFLEDIWPKDDFAAAHALLVVDIVDFGSRNRTLGRDVCDELLAAFARRLTATASDAENVARLGGDEFAILLKLSADVEDAETVAQRISRVFAEPVRAGDFELVMTVDIGLAVAPEDADSPETLLQRAETALSVVQEAGDHTPRRYTPGMADMMSAQAGDAVRALRRALARRELTLELQPIWRGIENPVVAAAKAEIVVDTAETGRRSGSDLFTYADNLGLTAELSAWCLRAVVETYADWRNIGLTPVPLLLPMPAEAAGTSMLTQAWQAAENRYRVPPPAVIVLPQGEGGEEASAVGLRVAREGKADGADILCLDTGTLKFDTAYAKNLISEGRERGIPMILGPLKEEECADVLKEAGIEYWYAKDEAPLTARAFGRLIARRGADPL